MPNFANFAFSTVLTAPSPANTGTSLGVQTGDGSKFPAVPFNVTVWPTGTQPSTTNAEIVTVTAVSADTFTITRAQEGSTARSIGVGDQIAQTVTAGELAALGGAPSDGWTSASGTWTYASATTITIPAGGLNIYSIGDKLMLTQGSSTLYFYVIAVADTILTITGGTEFTLTNSAITGNYFSKAVSPVGFPTSGINLSSTQVLTMLGRRAEIRGTSQVSASTAYSGHYYGDLAVTFALAFTSVPIIVGNLQSDAGNNGFMIFNSPTTAGCTMRLVAIDSNTTAETAGWVAIGEI